MTTVRDIQRSFETFAEASSTSIDVAYTDDELLIARCVLDLPFEVQPGDIQNGGVAVRSTAALVEVRPFLLRKVCTNGAIMLRSAAGSCVATADCTEEWLQEAFTSASSHEALSAAVTDVRAILSEPFDRAFLFATFMRQAQGVETSAVREMMVRMISGDFTGYSLMNAVTSVARDTTDPNTRWRLESIGGSIPALLLEGPISKVGADALNLPSRGFRLEPDLQLA